jgi:intracellular septation protein
MSESVADQRGTAAGAERNALLKLALEMGPLLVFFLANSRPDWFAPLVGAFAPQSLMTHQSASLFVATAVFMVAMAISLVLTKALLGRLPIMPLVSGVFVLVFGALTLWLENALFIKLKPTIVNLIFAAALLGSLAFRRLLLPVVLDSFFQLDEEGWRKLTLRWGLFFIALAGLNELVWRTTSDAFWAGFKLWGMMPITMIFGLAQTPLIMRHDTTGQYAKARDPAPGGERG